MQMKENDVEHKSSALFKFHLQSVVKHINKLSVQHGGRRHNSIFIITKALTEFEQDIFCTHNIQSIINMRKNLYKSKKVKLGYIIVCSKA